jgi:hypothetical protein
MKITRDDDFAYSQFGPRISRRFIATGVPERPPKERLTWVIDWVRKNPPKVKGCKVWAVSAMPAGDDRTRARVQVDYEPEAS